MIESKLFLIKMDGLANRVGTRVDAQGTQLDRTDPELFDFNAEVIQTQRKYFLFETIRSYAALRAADLDWIAGPGYSSGGYILDENHEKPTLNHEKP